MAPKPFVIIPFEGKPYEKAPLASASLWLARLPSRALSQRDLVEAWVVDEDLRVERIASEWLDGRFQTGVSAVREASPGLTVIRAEDADAVRRGERKAAEVALPMGLPPGK